ncbi:unnamed protein product [Phytophthora lilii]|uniref:Unnamed protein product n=1 Tax=Phytophthora lilii TaxID=2077276 RepID=A0A9W6WV05_9STRA|nr:unnamed protein product [Phytophthora lilii]
MGWAKKQRSPDKVFVSLKLDKAGDKLLENPAFNVWVAYTRMATNTNPERAILTSLTARQGMSANALFKLLKLDDNVDTLLKNPNLSTWAKYMTEVSATDSKLKTPMIDTPRAHFSDKELVRVFNAAKSDPQTKKLADLEGALINQLRLARLKKAQ